MKVRSGWREDMPAGQMWAVLKDGFLVSGKNALGTDSRHQPDSFRDNAGTLKPLLDSCNAPFAIWLQSQCHGDRQRYVEKRRAVAQMVRKVKNDWFQQKAKDFELRVLRGESGGAWRCICDIQRGRGASVSQAQGNKKQQRNASFYSS